MRVHDETDDRRRGERDPVHGRDDEEPHAGAQPGTGVARSDGQGSRLPMTEPHGAAHGVGSVVVA